MDNNDLATILSTVLIIYGFLLVSTNRTEYFLYMYNASFTRINLGILSASSGWALLFLIYGTHRERETAKGRSRRRK